MFSNFPSVAGQLLWQLLVADRAVLPGCGFVIQPDQGLANLYTKLGHFPETNKLAKSLSDWLETTPLDAQVAQLTYAGLEIATFGVGTIGKKFPRVVKEIDDVSISATGKTSLSEYAANAIADTKKFSDYIFKPGADHGKDAVFKSLGYTASDSVSLSKIWQQQAAEKYAKGKFVLGKADQYGQRIDIEIVLPGKGSQAGEVSYLRSGWMIQTDGTLKLNTPFSGFTRSQK